VGDFTQSLGTNLLAESTVCRQVTFAPIAPNKCASRKVEIRPIVPQGHILIITLIVTCDGFALVNAFTIERASRRVRQTRGSHAGRGSPDAVGYFVAGSAIAFLYASASVGAQIISRMSVLAGCNVRCNLSRASQGPV